METKICTKCNANIEANSSFCVTCGEQFVPEQTQPTAEGMHQQMMSGQMPIQQESFFKKHKKIIYGGGGLVAAVLLVVFVILPLFADSIAVRNALRNFGKEVSVRMDGTPFKMFSLLADAGDNFKVSAALNYTDLDFDGDISAIINFYAAQQEYALVADLSLMGAEFDVSAYLNSERFAIGSSILENSYGVNFATFESDFREFGENIKIPSYEIEEFLETITMLTLLFDTSQMPEISGDAYNEVIKAHLKSNESNAKKVRLNGSRVRRVEYAFNQNDLLKLFVDIVDVLEKDDALKEFLDEMFEVDATLYKEFIEELRYGIEELEREFKEYMVGINLKIAFYVGNNDRLMRSTFEVTLSEEGKSQGGARLVLDLGTSVNDDWTLTFYEIEENGKAEEIVAIIWSFEETNDSVINKIVIIGDSEEILFLSSEWNKNTGDFKLSVGNEYDEYSLQGNFVYNDKEFTLSFEGESDFDRWDFKISLEVGGVTVPTPTNLINLDQWTETTMEEIEAAIEAFLKSVEETAFGQSIGANNLDAAARAIESYGYAIEREIHMFKALNPTGQITICLDGNGVTNCAIDARESVRNGVSTNTNRMVNYSGDPVNCERYNYNTETDELRLSNCYVRRIGPFNWTPRLGATFNYN